MVAALNISEQPLTHEDVECLRQPFPARWHEFLGNYAYIQEWAICDRLDEVDPSWSFEVTRTERRDDQIIAYARMTVKGVSRENSGAQTIQYLTTGKGNDKTWRLDLDGNKIETGEPEKGAVTDALRRCARLFGIGRYLLRLPEKVHDEHSLDAWLNWAMSAKAQVDTGTGEIISNGNGHITSEDESPPASALDDQTETETYIPTPDDLGNLVTWYQEHLTKAKPEVARDDIAQLLSLEAYDNPNAWIKKSFSNKRAVVDTLEAAFNAREATIEAAKNQPKSKTKPDTTNGKPGIDFNDKYGITEHTALQFLNIKDWSQADGTDIERALFKAVVTHNNTINLRTLKLDAPTNSKGKPTAASRLICEDHPWPVIIAATDEASTGRERIRQLGDDTLTSIVEDMVHGKPVNLKDKGFDFTLLAHVIHVEDADGDYYLADEIDILPI